MVDTRKILDDTVKYLSNEGRDQFLKNLPRSSYIGPWTYQVIRNNETLFNQVKTKGPFGVNLDHIPGFRYQTLYLENQNNSSQDIIDDILGFFSLKELGPVTLVRIKCNPPIAV